MTTWKSIFSEVKWANDALIDKSTFKARDLIEINGHISDTGAYDMSLWNDLANDIYTYSGILDTKDNTILEIGCGSGALLKNFDINNNFLYGLDYSSKLLSVAEKALSNFKAYNKDANTINDVFDDNFLNLILSHSVFQYFPNQDYAHSVIEHAIKKLKTNGSIILTDLNDSTKELDSIEYRKNILGEKKYKELYEGENNKTLKHLFLNKDELIDLFKQNKMHNIKVTKAPKRGDEIDHYRFNIFGTKK